MGKERRKWRKEVKKLRRKRIRQKLAAETEKKNSNQIDIDNLEKDSLQLAQFIDVEERSEVETAIDSNYFLSPGEWSERERLTELENAMKRAREEKLAISRAEQEQKIRAEWEEQERKQKMEKEEKAKLEKARKEKQASLGNLHLGLLELFGIGWIKDDEEYSQFLDFLCGDIETPPLPYVMPEGFDTGEEVCLNFSKTGVCRYFERCKLVHQIPTLSRTILIPNFFSHFMLEESLRDEHDTDLGLEYEHSELYKEFLEFHSDVLTEFKKHGSVIQFKVCCNFEPHLRGNVYIQYENIRSAVEAFRTFNARFYNGKQISLRFVKIDSWKTAICWSFLRRHCIRGRSCNYLHVFRNPTKEFVLADRDWKDLASKKSVDQSLQKNWTDGSPERSNVNMAEAENSKSYHGRTNHRSVGREDWSKDLKESSKSSKARSRSRSRTQAKRNKHPKKQRDKSSRSERKKSQKRKHRSESPKPKEKRTVDAAVTISTNDVEELESKKSEQYQSEADALVKPGFETDELKNPRKLKKHKKGSKKKSKKSKHKKSRKC